jgi:TolB-like protein/Tfp pilus assembly protein PilF/predicted Ser/Thr protein kinase
MSLAFGAKLGPYEIVGPLGAGGMGEVYRAKDPRLNRYVAIKVSALQFSARFEREAKAIAALNHPNICQIYDLGPNYLVMELIEGTPLRGPLPLDLTLHYAVQICDALEAAHKKNITHRDLKPSNILVTESGVKLLDFGLAKMGNASAPPALDGTTQTTDITAAGTVLGTAAYMSPEQAKSEETDARSDIFSFGLVLYEMLSGHPAFLMKSAIETMAAIVRDEPAPLDAPPKLSAIVTRCLRKLPDSRFQTINEVRAALEQVMAVRIGDAPSIAVLPFANMSRNAEDEYFSDGLAEEIINALAQVQGLKVIARTSAFAFKRKNEDIRKIAEALGVRNVLEGSVRRAGNRLRVTAQLINAADGMNLWSQRYDRDMTDVFAIQDEISQAISEALQVRLAPRAKMVNLEAYQNYLKGQYHRAQATPESLAKAKECFEQALAIDPNYAPAYSGLAAYYYLLSAIGITPTGEVAHLAKSAAENALSIDPNSSEAYSVLGVMAAFDYDWKLVGTHFRKAMSVEPVPPMTRFRYAQYYLIPLGRFADAMEQSRLALETDPLSMPVHFGMAWAICCAKQYQETIEYARRALEIDPNFYLLWLTMAFAQLDAGFTQEAIMSLKRVVELAPWYNIGIGTLAAAYYQAGDHERCQEWARKLAEAHSHTVGAAFYYAAAGKVDAMFEALEGAYRQRSLDLRNIKNWRTLPFFDPYRSYPRFQALLARMNLV